MKNLTKKQQAYQTWLTMSLSAEHLEGKHLLTCDLWDYEETMKQTYGEDIIDQWVDQYCNS